MMNYETCPEYNERLLRDFVPRNDSVINNEECHCEPKAK